MIGQLDAFNVPSLQQSPLSAVAVVAEMTDKKGNKHQKKRGSAAAPAGSLVKDERFQHVHKDPRFQRLPKQAQTFKVDKRFERMFNDPNFKMDCKFQRPFGLLTIHPTRERLTLLMSSFSQTSLISMDAR